MSIAAGSAATLGFAAALALGGCNGSGPPRYQGWVEANLLFIGPDEAGRVEALSVREGDTVAAGASLFGVDAELQAADVHAATAAVAEARARLARLENAQQRKEEIAVLEAQERRAQSALVLSTAELERQRALSEKAIAAKAQLDIATANFNRDTAALDEVRRQIAVARMPSRDEDIAAARQALAAAEAKLTAAQTRLARRRLASPAAGSVQQVYYRVGELVPALRPVLALLPPGNVKLRFYVPEPVLAKVGSGDRVRVECDGCPADLMAHVSFIARTAEFTPPVIYSLEERAKLVFLIEALPERPDAFRVGQPIRVTLEISAPRS
ncbi:MAG TPA: HlyD family efflux transporter periplasmic adaptor subunit [Xanthobacteraceae bacterium]